MKAFVLKQSLRTLSGRLSLHTVKPVASIVLSISPPLPSHQSVELATILTIVLWEPCTGVQIDDTLGLLKALDFITCFKAESRGVFASVFGKLFDSMEVQVTVPSLLGCRARGSRGSMQSTEFSILEPGLRRRHSSLSGYQLSFTYILLPSSRT